MKLPVERVEQSLDPGLLVEPVFPTSLPPKKVLKGKWIGINWGTSYNKIFGGSELQVEDRLVKVIRKLIKKRLSDLSLSCLVAGSETCIAVISQNW